MNELKSTLLSIQLKDPSAPGWAGSDSARETAYQHRTLLIYRALYLAADLGMECGIRFDPKSPEWPVVFIQLPTGQVSWHMAQYQPAWDGHSTADKYARIRKFALGVQLSGSSR